MTAVEAGSRAAAPERVRADPDAPSRPGRLRARIPGLVRASGPAAAAVLTAAACLVQVDRRQMWVDELISYRMSAQPVHAVLTVARQVDAVFAPYYVFLHGWTAVFGRSELALRLPSLLGLAVAAAMVVVLGTRFFDRRTGTVAGLLFAVLPSVSRYGQEVRPYGLAVGAATLSTVLLVRATDRPDWRRLALYACSVPLVAASHLLSLLVIVPHVCYAALVLRLDRDRRVWRWFGALGCGLAPVVPLLYRASGQRDLIAWVGRPTLSTLPKLPDVTFGSAAVGFLVVALAVIQVRRPSIGLAMLATWAVGPLVILFVVSQWVPTLHGRYLLFTLPAWCLLAAGAATSLGRLAARTRLAVVPPVGRVLAWCAPVALVAAALVLGLPAQRDYRATTLDGQPDFSGADRLVAAQYRPGDYVLHRGRTAAESRIAMEYLIPAADRPVDAAVRRAAEQFPALTLATYYDSETPEHLANAPRIWVLNTDPDPDPTTGLENEDSPLGDWLRDHFTVAEVDQYAHLAVTLLVRNG